MPIAAAQGDRWKAIKALLMDALVLDPDERAAYLKSQPAPVDVRSEVESLLSFESDADAIMRVSAIELSRDFFCGADEDPCTIAGQQIGAYRIVSELGIGGMGAVYLAERVDGKFDQRVAIKLLKREFNAGKLRGSFRREIEIQSKLVHPNVAAVIDTGATDDGIPYIVMEYVEGRPIDKYCSENDLGLDDRLKIFNKACEAVAFAHHNLIVHRDLKPSNIIVTSDGNPKLLDFGISKLLGAADEAARTTMLGAMTPEYASPEQIKGEPVSTAADIYSLGVILFKMLTDGYPYDLRTKANGDVQAAITRAEPSLPSVAARKNAGERSRINEPQLKGDLDNIILKALRKAPEHRYRTVEQFSDDIWRFIDGLPVRARAHSLGYRASKFFQRNRVSVISGAVVFFSLILGITGALWQTDVARAQARIALVESENAKAEQEKSEKISKFMAKIISYANPRWDTDGAKSNGQAKVIDVLFEMSDRIDTEFPDNLDVRAELHHKFAEVFQTVGLRIYGDPRAAEAKERAKLHARFALELRREHYGERHELVAKDLAYLYWTTKMEPMVAAKTMAEAIQMMRETNPKNANLPHMLGSYAGELMLPTRHDSAYQQKYPREQYHTTYLAAAIPQTSVTQYELAEKYLRESLPLLHEQYGEDNYAIFITECYLAFSLAKQEKWGDLEQTFRRCKLGESVVKDQTSLKDMKRLIGLVDAVVAEKRGGPPE